MKKKLLVAVAAVVVLAAVAVGAVYVAQKSSLSGTEFTRDGIRWTLSGGTASVSGEGVPADLAEQYESEKGRRFGLLDRLEKDPPIRKVVLGPGITGVNDTTFRGLEQLREIEVEEGNPYLSAADGMLFSKDGSVLLHCPPAGPGASCTVPEGTAEIGSAAFAGNTVIKKAVLPEGLTRIGIDAFSGCAALEEIALSEGTQFIGEGAFENCAALKTVSLPDSLATVGDRAFNGCASLSSVTIPAGLKKLGECAFRGCAGMTEFRVAEGNTVFSAVDGVLLRSGGKVLAQYPRGAGRGAWAVPEGVEEIDYAAFEGNAALTEATLPDSLTKIGTAAFKDCTALTRVAMPDHVRAIGDAAYSGCTALREVTLAKYLETIGIEAFFNCPALKTVEVPFKVTFVGFRSLGYDALFGSKKYTEGFLLRCREGSRAQDYAEEYGVAYEIVG